MSIKKIGVAKNISRVRAEAVVRSSMVLSEHLSAKLNLELTHYDR